ncbi:MAG: peptidase, partial [Acidobacteria bacterium]|nr:peptidase [Acidobacteriota bacterium]
QHLVIAAATRDLIPYISDAVPGWFQAFITLFDPKGKKVGYADHFRFQQDPLIEYEVAEDGEYSLEIHDSIYRGREDFVYRITAGELPFVTDVFPLGGKAGSKSKLEIKGWNLPVSKLTEDNKRKAPGIYPVSVRKGEWTSNQMPFAVDTLKESSEKEANDRKERAQKIKLPLIVNGRIDKPGDCDVFRFDGRAGQQVVAEVLARRLDSPLDSVLKLTDANGKQIAFNDDYEDRGMGLMTFQADSWLSATLPAKGRYYLYLRDREEKGGPDYAYRLRISAPRPDFELRITPASINARAGSTVPVTVYAVRRDGFAGDIALKLKDAPSGFSLDGGWIPSGQDQVRLTLTIPPTRMDQPLALHVEGRANIQGHEVTRPGVPAENMMQAFAYHHLVPAHDWMVRVLGSGRYRLDWRLAANKPVKVPAGGTAPVKVTVPLKRLPGPVHLTLNEPPQGIAIQNISRTKDGVSFLLRADSAKAKAGLKGNLIVDAFTERAAKEKEKPVMRTVPLGTLPAIPFEIVASR